MIRAVIFDFNGVLVDDESVHFELFREVLAEEGVAHHRAGSTTSATSASTTAAASRRRWPTPGRPSDRPTARRADRAQGRAVRRGRRAGPAVLPRRGRDAWPPWPTRWPVAICSGALRPEIEYALGRLGVRDRVAAIVSAEDADTVQARPRGLPAGPRALRARARAGRPARPAHCLVVEDSLAGIVSAKGAGMWAVGVTHTYTPRAPPVGADAVIDGLET